MRELRSLCEERMAPRDRSSVQNTINHGHEKGKRDGRWRPAENIILPCVFSNRCDVRVRVGAIIQRLYS